MPKDKEDYRTDSLSTDTEDYGTDPLSTDIEDHLTPTDTYSITYQIADIVIRLYSSFPLIDSVNASTFYTEEEHIDFTLTFEKTEDYSEAINDYEIIAEGLGENVLVSHGREYRNFIYQNATYAMTRMNGQTACCYYQYEDAVHDMMKRFRRPLSFCCLEQLMLHYGRIILHSSHINYKGDSIVISAPSGTGKSTHADLWEKYYGATVVNGDRSIIGRKRISSEDFSGDYHAYGLPMCGSSNIFRNMEGRLKAIVVIRQSEDNHVERPNRMAAFRYILSETTQNSWNPAYMDQLMNLIEDLISQVPVYVLYCNMDRSAADCLHDAIYS